MKIVFVQTVIPSYSVSFFNEIMKVNSNIELTILADINKNSILNQFSEKSIKFKVVSLKEKRLSGLVLRPKLRKILRNINPDVIIYSGNPRELSQLVAMFWSRICKQKFLVWGMFHRIGGPRFISRLYYKTVGHLANMCLPYGRTGGQTLLNLGVDKKKIYPIGTAIDEKRIFTATKALSQIELDRFLDDHDLSGKKIVLQVVRLSRIKKPELLLYAAKKILAYRNDFHFVIIGKGEMYDEVHMLSKELGVDHAVSFLGSIYEERVLAHWFGIAHCFVIPTCIGLSAHHALSYGVPVVTDNSLDNQATEFEILAHGLNAFIYDEGNIEDLSEKIITAAELDQEYRSIINFNAIKTIKNNANLESKARNFLKAIAFVAP